MPGRLSRLAALLLAVPMALGLVLTATSPVRAAPTVLVATLTGAQEVPPGDPDGEGSAFLVIDPEAGTICPAFIDYTGIAEPTAAHIHIGPAGVNGLAVVDLFAPPDPDGFIENCLDSLDSTLLQAIVDTPAAYYVNVHNGDFPDGAIRGQLEVPPPPPNCTPPNLCGSFTDGPGTAVPGNYLYPGFAADLSFTLAEPWLSFVVPDGFILGPPDAEGEIFVGRVEGTVYTGACGATPATIPITPQSYLDFFASHPNVTITAAAQATTLGGASGFVLDVVGTGTALCPDGIALLMQSGVEEGLPPEAGQYVIADGEVIRVWLLSANGETIFIAVSDWASGTFATLMARAQPVLNSMSFALAAAPAPTATPAPTQAATPAGTAPPLPNTAYQESVEPGSGPLWVALAGVLVLAVAARRLRRIGPR